MMKRAQLRAGIAAPASAFVLSLLLWAVASCDLLRLAPFEVLAATPSAGYQADPTAIDVSVSFSADCDRLSVERAFSLSADGIELRGRFEWRDRTLRFIPLVPFEAGRAYLLALDSGASDARGQSLSREWRREFSTIADGPRPILLSSVPEDGAFLEGARTELRFSFSEALSLPSVLRACSVAPQLRGVWTLDAGGRELRFLPLEDWELDTQYVFRHDASLAAEDGRLLGVSRELRFARVLQTEAPRLLQVRALDEAGLPGPELVPDSGGNATAGWERGWRLEINFSTEVDLEELDACVAADGLELRREGVEAYASRALYGFREAPAWGDWFSILLEGSLGASAGAELALAQRYRVCADGQRSRPPEFRGLRFPLAPGNLENPDLVVRTVEDAYAEFPLASGAERYPLDIPTAIWFELYFAVAEGARVDLFSLMESFSLDATNSCASFELLAYRDAAFTLAEPAGDFGGALRVEAHARVTNRAAGGIVRARVAAGLRDTHGNMSTQTALLPLQK